MINVILIGIGAAVFILSFFKYMGIIKITEEGSTKKYWIILSLLTLFFFVGYIFQIFVEISNIQLDDKLMISAIYCFGAIYVFLVVSLSLSSIRKIHESKKATEDLKKRSDEIESAVRERTNDLEKLKKELESKVVELEKFRKLAVGRELKMAEMKKRAEEMESKNK